MLRRLSISSAIALGTLALMGAAPVPPAPERYRSVETPEVPDFQRHVLPLFGKLGCNGRACHGSFQGQGGFRLSLFGYDFKQDHEALTAGESPRVDLALPESSRILDKATLTAPHKGGRRMEIDGWEYNILLRWIESGAKGVDSNHARFERLEAIPSRVVFDKSGETAQLRVLAHWADGTSEDVTPLCRYRTNDESIAEIDDKGQITCVNKGASNVVAFYDNGVAPVEVILPVSDRTGPNYPSVPTPTKIDELVVDRLKLLGIVPSDPAEDAEFLRRVSIDIAGTLPTSTEVTAFLADNSADKRAQKIDELLESPAYAAWWATRLSDMVGNTPKVLVERVAQIQQANQFYVWLYRRVAENLPYDELVSRMMLATSRRPGQDYESYLTEMSAACRANDPEDQSDRETMPHFWSRTSFAKPDDRAIGVAFSFLGVRLQCAQCHKHPFDQWTQDDFQKFASFFGRVAYGAAPDHRKQFQEMKKDLPKDNKEKLALVSAGARYPWGEVFVAPPNKINPRRKDKPKQGPQPVLAITAKYLGGDDVDLNDVADPRTKLIEWFRDKENPYFARAFVNRVWAAYFGVGIVEPADDLNLANPPSNAALLTYLAEQFVAHEYDMRWLHREIANSRTYQLGWKTNETNAHDSRNFSHSVPRRIPAEVAQDAIRQATATLAECAATAQDPLTRAIALGSSYGRNGIARGNDYTLTVFGRPERTKNCDCERSNEVSLLQTIYLRNDQQMLGSLARSGWLREVQQQTLRPASQKPAEVQAVNANADEDGETDIGTRIAKIEQRLKRFKKEGNAERVAVVTKRLEMLRRMKARMEREGGADKSAAAKDSPATPAVALSESTTRERIVDAYLRTLSRMPTDEEVVRCLRHFREAENPMIGLRDLLWALLNTKEFIVNH